MVGYNSALTPLKERAKKQSQKAKSGKELSKYALSLTSKRRLRKRQLKELSEVAKFVSLDNGCWHVFKEWYLFSGKFERPPPFARIQICRTQCPMCTGEWHKVHLPMYKSGLGEFFISTHGSNCIPCPLDVDKSLGQRMKSSPFWIGKIFDRSTKAVKKELSMHCCSA